MHEYLNILKEHYDENEARSILRVLLEDAFGITWVDACLGAVGKLTPDETERLNSMIAELKKGRPVQYVTGKADFCGRTFLVEEGVLIPRPETEMLIPHPSSLTPHPSSLTPHPSILDIGCGSGCIAITIALNCPEARVTAWDISDTALSVAMRNAEKLGACVEFVKQDALDSPKDDVEKWDIIVSNPPYICNKEARDMEKNVLDYEPHLALFVPDDDPLLFYRKIAEYGTHALKNNGQLRFEINSAYGEDTVQLLRTLGYTDITLIKDCFDNDRMVVANHVLSR